MTHDVNLSLGGMYHAYTLKIIVFGIVSKIGMVHYDFIDTFYHRLARTCSLSIASPGIPAARMPMT